MLYTRTYFDKCATIVRDSSLNSGFNPVAELVYGGNLSRFLIHFDHSRLSAMHSEKVLPELSNLRHTLKIKNAGSLDFSELHKTYGSQIGLCEKKRASSFDLILFLIPRDWDGGKGFDLTRNYFNTEFYSDGCTDRERYVSEDGVNWFKPVNGSNWKDSIPFQKTVDDQVVFNIKSDTKSVGLNGGVVTFTYKCGCNDIEMDRNVRLVASGGLIGSEVKIGNPIHFSASGRVCETEEEIIQYGSYVKATATIPSGKTGVNLSYSFRLEYDIDGKTYKSNPYKVIQYGSGMPSYPVTENGVYSTDTLEKELEKHLNGEESLIVGIQHFDIGCEDLCVDMTDTVNKFITGELENYGIGIAFAPTFEYMEGGYENYVGFITNRTNTFFEPYLETICTESIEDNRVDFVLGRKNRLYLYSDIGGNLENLDFMPTCTIDGVDYEVRQASKGVYYVEVMLGRDYSSSPTMLYDTWDNIYFHGENVGPVEMNFTAHQPSTYFRIGSSLSEKQEVTPSAYGILDSENVKRGDIRKIGIVFRKNYTRDIGVDISTVEARLYVMDGTAQVEAIPYIKADRSFGETYIMLDTSILVPNTYYMDVRIRLGMETIVHREVLKFVIVNEENNKYA